MSDTTHTEAARIAEFARQWSMARVKSDEIYSIHWDPDGDRASLLCSDVLAILEQREELVEVLELAATIIGHPDCPASQQIAATIAKAKGEQP